MVSISGLLFRSTIGFDRHASPGRGGHSSLGYPPYNIERTGDDAYRLTMAVPGSRRVSST